MFALTVSLFLGVESTSAEEMDESLAKQSQNPVGDIISLPFVSRFDFDAGPEDAFAYTMELKPVYPINLGELNLINRLIVPITYQEAKVDGQDDEFGLSDTVYQAFFSPAKPEKIIWGAGPAIIIPTHTDDALGNDKWAAGPAVVVLAKPGHWLFGTLVQHFWDFAGDNDAAEVNLSSIQIFINYNFPEFYLTTSPTFNYNHEADSGDRWTVPLGGGVGKLVKFGKMPVDFKLTAYNNVEAPDSAPDWYTEFQVKFLFPKK
jgi:hypothetical protein